MNKKNWKQFFISVLKLYTQRTYSSKFGLTQWNEYVIWRRRKKIKFDEQILLCHCNDETKVEKNLSICLKQGIELVTLTDFSLCSVITHQFISMNTMKQLLFLY